jgi:hypothetical protein
MNLDSKKPLIKGKGTNSEAQPPIAKPKLKNRPIIKSSESLESQLEIINQAKLEFEAIKSEKFKPIFDALMSSVKSSVINVPDDYVGKDTILEYYSYLNYPVSTAVLQEPFVTSGSILNIDNYLSGLEQNPNDLRLLTLVELINQESIKLNIFLERIIALEDILNKKLPDLKKLKYFKIVRFEKAGLFDLQEQIHNNLKSFSRFRNVYSPVSRGVIKISCTITTFLKIDFELDTLLKYIDDSPDVNKGIENESNVSKSFSKEPSNLFCLSTPRYSSGDIHAGADMISFHSDEELDSSVRSEFEELVQKLTYYSYAFSLVKHYDVSQGDALFGNFVRNMVKKIVKSQSQRLMNIPNKILKAEESNTIDRESLETCIIQLNSSESDPDSKESLELRIKELESDILRRERLIQKLNNDQIELTLSIHEKQQPEYNSGYTTTPLRQLPVYLAPNQQLKIYKDGEELDYLPSIAKEYESKELSLLNDEEKERRIKDELAAMIEELMFKHNIIARIIQIKSTLRDDFNAGKSANKNYHGVIGPIGKDELRSPELLWSFAINKADPAESFIT